ncbi:carbon-nitrogen hydrolase family protein [Pikeienuella piscinae]|uniref:Carbon-nitrogen hydrolase family protein n=1 Tax=Pikeienuella piscinae TaxID=2748098 RepID=A0A7M3T5V5_9RHOB|nr:carbon-nitrogen hydrolase family protein [Pikeienuella piscinae]QIE57386.1 carbon-nitrogen hydrolase family protein [Pikeienuella piscinae]
MPTAEIACLQTRVTPDFETALAEALGLGEEAVAAGAEFLLLPEYCGGLTSDGAALRPPAAPEAEHPVLAGLRDFAAKRGVWLMVGSVAVTGPGGKIVNRGFVLDAAGAIVSRYDKIHMFDIQLSAAEAVRESALVSPGDAAVVVETPFGRVGHTICYDLRFPHLYRDLAQAGAEILTAPAAFTKKTGEAHWHILNRARAVENLAWMVSPCAVGDVPGGGEAYGHSLVVAPWGDIVAEGGDGPGVVRATLDLTAPAAARERIPSLDHDRAFRSAGAAGKRAANAA